MWDKKTIYSNQDSYNASIKAIFISVFFLVIVLAATLSRVIGTYSPEFLTSLIVSITFTSIFIFVIGILKIKNPWVKYILVIIVTLAVSYINIFCMMNNGKFMNPFPTKALFKSFLKNAVSALIF